MNVRGALRWGVAFLPLIVAAALFVFVLGSCAPSRAFLEAQETASAADRRLEDMKAEPERYTLEEWTSAVSAWQEAQAALAEAGQAEADRTLTGLPYTIELLLGLGGTWLARDYTRKRKLAQIAPAHPSES